MNGGKMLNALLRPIFLRVRTLRTDRRGVILLAVLVFVALLLPLVTLVLTGINTESVATAEMVKGAKVELAAEKAINDAIALVVFEKELPDYWTSAANSQSAIIVYDPASGYRRDQIPGGSGANPGATGPDDLLGTADDYWVGPRRDRSHIGATDYETSPRNYYYDFRYSKMNGPTYIGQGWSRSTDYREYSRSQFNGNWMWLLNQYAAETFNDADGDLFWDGYEWNASDPFSNAADANEPAVLSGPGYYRGADDPRVGGPGTPVNRVVDNNNDIEDYMFNAKVNLYESVYSDLDRGPMPSSLLKSYANVTDEAGRLNLNIFCKKVRLYMPESSETDYDLEGYGTDDFNGNGVENDDGWKWLDNPLFPDRNSTLKLDFNPDNGRFYSTNSANEEGTAGFDPSPIDWGSLDALTGTFNSNTDGISMPELGENVQHYYLGTDSDGDSIPDSIESCRASLKMLMTLPGVDGMLAARILEYLNPTLADLPDNFNPALAATWPPSVHDGSSNYTGRLDACNVTPPLEALYISVNSATGTVDEFRWDFEFSDEDDLPLPQPRPLTSVEQLMDVPGMTPAKFNLIKDFVTVSSYDTNVIATNIQDVAWNTDLVNAYVPGDPQYNGQVRRIPSQDEMDFDSVSDLRYDVSRIVFGLTLDDYRQAAEAMYAQARAHLPQPLMQKIVLPVVDRWGRSTNQDSYTANTDVRYNPGSGTLLLPHRQSGAAAGQAPYNVGTFGHQEDNATLGRGAGYPALNPEFSLDSCLSIVLYRNGTVLEEDDYSYNPQGGAWLPAANRGLLNLFPWGLPFFAELLGPFARLIFDFIEPNNNPLPFTGYNIDAQVKAHGPGSFDYASLTNFGSLDSAADLLDIPRYSFSGLSASIMADPPSASTADYNGNGTIQANELIPVNYYLTFSDVVDTAWYISNISGPDGERGTADDPDQSRVLYRMNFALGNRPGANPNPIDPNAWRAQLNITPLQLKLVGPKPTESRNGKVTLVVFDNVNNLDVIGPSFSAPLLDNFGWDDVPDPTTPVGTAGSDADGRPLEAAYWHPGPNPQFNNANSRQAWAFDSFGDPYLTSRLEVIRWDPTANAPATPEARTDEICKVYLQYNETSRIPFRVDVMAVRVAGDEYELRSSYGGAETSGGSFLLYDWEYASDPASTPDDRDGTWPRTAGLAADPRVVRLTPETTNVTLHLYDLRTFTDALTGLPLAGGDYTLNAGIVSGGVVNPPQAYPAPNFPTDPHWIVDNPATGYPIQGYLGHDGYAEASASVEQVTTSTQVRVEISAEEPTVYTDVGNNLARYRTQTVGGTGVPYSLRLRILDPNLGSVGGGGGPYQGPDSLGPADPFAPPPGPIGTWPGVAAPPNHPRRSEVPYNNGAQYDDASGGILHEQTIASNDTVHTFSVDIGALIQATTLTAGNSYWVEIRAADGTNPVAYAYTKLTVGVQGSPSGSSGIPPDLNLSINLEDLGDSRKGFQCSAAVDGGRPGYGYYWAVTRPVFGDTLGTSDVIVDEEIVDQSTPWLSIDAVAGATGAMALNPAYSGSPMESNEDQPVFEFHPGDFYDNATGSLGGDGVPDGDGLYIVHCYVLDRVGSNSFAGSVLAHDVAMVTLSDTGTSVGGAPSPDSRARTPMAVLAANPPGNETAPVADNPAATGGSNRPYIGSVTVDPALEPDVAGRGETIVIRGFNFNAAASANVVTFGGGATALGLNITPPSPTDQLIIGGSSYGQQELTVQVPQDALTGYITVSNGSGTSDRTYFFQTGFEVVFDLLGKLSPNDPTYLHFDLDYQGDGRIDFSFDTASTPEHNGQVRGIMHDFAEDGVGNYNATLYVTDLVSGRHQTSHQLITIRDKRPQSQLLQPILNGGTVSFVGSESGLQPTATISDTISPVSYRNLGVQVGDRVINYRLNETVTVLDVFYDDAVNAVDTELRLSPLSGGNVWQVGDRYDIVRFVDNTTLNTSSMASMLVNIWPEIDLRSYTFTPDNTSGLMFRSALGGINALTATYKWQVDGGAAEAGLGGTLVTSGWVTQVPGGYNSPATSSLDNILIDTGNNFNNAGNIGVHAGDLVVSRANGVGGTRSANVQTVNSATQLTVVNPADPTYAQGLRPQTGTVTRQGVITLTDNTGGNVWDTNNHAGFGFDFVGLDYGPYNGFAGEGGIVAGDTVLNVTTGATATVTSVAVGHLTTTPLAGGVNPIVTGIAQAPAGGNSFRMQTAVGRVDIGDAITNLTTGVAGVITGIAGNIVTTDVPTWTVGDQYSISTASGAWRIGDTWRILVPRYQFRIGFLYDIFTEVDFNTSAYADADFASRDAEIKYHIEMNYPFDLDPTVGNPTTVLIDWNGPLADTPDGPDADAYPDSWGVYSVGNSSRLDGEVNGLELEYLNARHTFDAGELQGAIGAPGGALSQARYRVLATRRGVAGARAYPTATTWYNLPDVMIGGDDFDTDLTTLNVIDWDSDNWHQLALAVSYLQRAQLVQNPLAGATNSVIRRYIASDAIQVPPGMAGYANSLSTWVSYDRPFITTNNVNVTNLRHQAVHGAGSALNWMSDANADTAWASNYSESPLGDNPVNTYMFLVANGANQMVTPGATFNKGASFPRIAPGVGDVQASGGFRYYEANRGLYNGYGFVTDNLAPDARAFAFDTQALFLGDRTNNSSTETRPLEADFAIDPLVGTNNQIIRFNSYVTGGNSDGSYTYRWYLEKFSDPTGQGGGIGWISMEGTLNPASYIASTNSNPVFDPAYDIADENDALFGWDFNDVGRGGALGDGDYRVWMIVSENGGGGSYTSCYREFMVKAPTLSISVMADPPSASIGDVVQYHIFIDGGRPPYRISADFDSNAPSPPGGPGLEVTNQVLNNGNFITLSHYFSEARIRQYDPLGNITQNGYLALISVTDASGNVAQTSVLPTAPDVDVEVADTIPLNVNVLATPVSGVAPFITDIHYAVSGGQRLANGEYDVSIQLIGTGGDVVDAATRSERSTFGPNGVPNDPRLPTSDDDPVQLLVPTSGNYYVQVVVTDGGGRVATGTEDIFASGYLMPVNYGSTNPQVQKDAEQRPLHAVRIWVDPFLSIHDSDTSNFVNNTVQTYANQQEYVNVGGRSVPVSGRLMEADLQVLGDMYTADPNSSFRSYGMYAAKDPLSQQPYRSDFSALGESGQNVTDFYDTFTFGRVNLNTASEEALTAVFQKIIVRRGYVFPDDVSGFGGYADQEPNVNNTVDIDFNDDGTITDNERVPYLRYPPGDQYMTEADARQLARDVIDYRTAYYDMYKPEPASADQAAFGYQASNSGDADLGTMRVDHLPVIGPWDGINPHEYVVDDRDSELQDADQPLNAYDHLTAQYYAFTGANMYYAPTDVAYVRDLATIQLVTASGPQPAVPEPLSNYAKYLNDVMSNDFWYTDRYDGNPTSGTEFWDSTVIYQSATNNYSRWAFDARNYFVYDGGDLIIDASNPAGLGYAWAGGSVRDARNKQAIFNSGGVNNASESVTAYTYISNPPFESIFDLYKVIDQSENPATFQLRSAGGSATLALQTVTGNPVVDTTISNRNNLYTNAQKYSGPSRFRYMAHWHETAGEFIPVCNYLDDIAPFVTCRSYTFRIEGAGAVTGSGGGESGVLDTARISRDRSKTAIIDVGPLWARRSQPVLTDIERAQGLEGGDQQLAYKTIWYKDESQ